MRTLPRTKPRPMTTDDVKFTRRWFADERIRLQRDLIRRRWFVYWAATPQAPKE